MFESIELTLLSIVEISNFIEFMSTSIELKLDPIVEVSLPIEYNYSSTAETLTFNSLNSDKISDNRLTTSSICNPSKNNIKIKQRASICLY